MRLIEEFSDSEPSVEAKNQVWSYLRDFITDHRTYTEESAQLPGPEMDRIENLLRTLAPADLIEGSAWLFNDHFPELASGERDWHEREKKLLTLRADTIREIFTIEGSDGLIRLAGHVVYPWFVAQPIANMFDAKRIDALMDRALNGGNNLLPFASSLSRATLEVKGDRWRAHILERAGREAWPQEHIVTCLKLWPDERRTWGDVARFGSEAEAFYWRQKDTFPLKGPVADLEYAVGKYIGVDRALAALYIAAHRSRELSVDTVFTILDRGLPEVAKSPARERIASIKYHVKQLFEGLAGRIGAPEIEVARREYQWLPILVPPGSTPPLNLHEILAKEPAFFVQVLCDVYKARPVETDRAPTEEEITRARLGHRLLDSWTRLPGLEASGTVNAKTLEEWVSRARQLAAKAERASVGDLEIGGLLAYAPNDPEDGAWPHRAVRDVIEKEASDRIERSIRSEQFNKRGMHWKGMFEGGEQERALASKARQWAVCASGWLRTAKLLRSIADMWEGEANSADLSAKKDEIRFS